MRPGGLPRAKHVLNGWPNSWIDGWIGEQPACASAFSPVSGSVGVRVPPPGPRPGRPHLSAPLRPAVPFPVAPPRAGPDSRRTSSGSAVAAGRRRVGAPAGPGPEPSRGRGSSGDPRRRGRWDCDGRGDRDHLPGRRYQAVERGKEEGSQWGAGRTGVWFRGGAEGARSGGGPRMGAAGGETTDRAGRRPSAVPSAPTLLGNEGGGREEGVCCPPPPRGPRAASAAAGTARSVIRY